MECQIVSVAAPGFPWPTFWAALSAVATLATFGVAVVAMFRWRKQDELKAKLAFKQALCNYGYCLVKLPEKLDSEELRVINDNNTDELVEHLAACTMAWYALEGLMEKNNKISGAWDFIYHNTMRYCNGEISHHDLCDNCETILLEKFIFK
ncbi:hypothetical protein [Citrobacter arsenatis]|uniref:hypothetical protein n=1 Tax=Citrobacter arsenatis TaxID=2546350 RepID=UPI00300E4E9C